MSDLRAIAVPDGGGAGPSGQALSRGEKRGRDGHPRGGDAGKEKDGGSSDRERLENADKQLRQSEAAEAADEFERRKTIMRIKAYASGFNEFCGELVASKALEDMTQKMLDRLLKEVKFAVAAKTSTIVTKQAANGGLMIAQQAAKGIGWEVDGPRIALCDLAGSNDYNMLVTELMLEYMDIIYQRPEYRMVAFMGQSIFTMDRINREAKEKALAVPNKDEDPNPRPVQRPRTDQEPGGVVVEDVSTPAPFNPPPATPDVPVQQQAPPPPQYQQAKPPQNTTVGATVKPKPAPKNK